MGIGNLTSKLILCRLSDISRMFLKLKVAWMKVLFIPLVKGGGSSLL